jgi:multidrug efflux system outer membrane protein
VRAAPAQFKEAGRHALAGFTRLPAEAQDARRLVEGLQRPGARCAGEARRREQHQHPGRAARLAEARALARSANADRSPQVGLGAAPTAAQGLDKATSSVRPRP